MADELIFDVSDDLQKIDDVITTLINDQTEWDSFVQRPNETLIKLGLHPATSPEINSRANKLIFAAIANKELLQLFSEHYQDFRARSLEHIEHFEEGLTQGKIQNKLEFDLDGFEHFARNPEVMRKAYRILLRDINAKGLLQKNYSDGEIESYIDKAVHAVINRLPLKDHPVLERWDENYGIGPSYGATTFEVDLPVTVVAPVEFAAPATVFGQHAHVDTKKLFAKAAEGSHDHLKATMMLTQIAELSARLIQRAEQEQF